VDGLARALHEVNGEPCGLHHHVGSIHAYPGMIVIEKTDGNSGVRSTEARTDWRPFW
jgi:hypothetical protein